jgi:hypothetical protein
MNNTLYLGKMSMQAELEARETTFDKATPMVRPHAHGQAGLFVPISGFEGELPATLKKGAAIVGFGNPNGTLTIYFESNRFDDGSLHRWEDKAQLAFRRMVDHLPTTSKGVAQPNQMEQVGVIDSDGFRLTRFESLKRYLARNDASDTAPSGEELTWR